MKSSSSNDRKSIIIQGENKTKNNHNYFNYNKNKKQEKSILNPFKTNIKRYNKVNTFLNEYGLKITGRCVVDVTLPFHMHSVICEINTKKINLNSTICLSDFPEIHEHINARQERINQAVTENEKMHIFKK